MLAIVVSMRAKGGGINSGMNLKLHLSLPTLQSLLVPIELNDSYLPRTWSESPPHPHIGVQSAMQRRVWGLPSLLTLKLVHIFYNSLACGGLCGESRYRSGSHLLANSLHYRVQPNASLWPEPVTASPRNAAGDSQTDAIHIS